MQVYDNKWCKHVHIIVLSEFFILVLSTTKILRRFIRFYPSVWERASLKRVLRLYCSSRLLAGTKISSSLVLKYLTSRRGSAKAQRAKIRLGTVSLSLSLHPLLLTQILSLAGTHSSHRQTDRQTDRYAQTHAHAQTQTQTHTSSSKHSFECQALVSQPTPGDIRQIRNCCFTC